MDTLFYDGQCPLCAREIRTLRKLQKGDLVFADIHAQENCKDALPGREAMLRRLHLLTGDGEWVVGLPANVRAWSHTRFGFLFRPLLWPAIHPVAKRVYANWADKRYDTKYACGACNV